MCNIAGYIGPRPAAPVLCGMMRRQSGFCGGYYSGIVTCYDGKLAHAKLLGDMDLLVSELRADTLPGNYGLIHSRSRSGGDSRWAHPFLSFDGRIAYIANGSGGKLAAFRERDAAVEKLAARGYVFDTADDRRIGSYPRLPDGRSVHGSEAMAFLIRDHMLTDGLCTAEAMRESFLEYPAEIVGLAVSADEPDTISFARFNKPCVIARTADEVFLASTAIALPDDRRYISITPVPECSYGTVTLRETRISRMIPPLEVVPVTPSVLAGTREAVLGALEGADRPLSFREVARPAAGLWPRDRVGQLSEAVYEVLYELYRDGTVSIEKQDAPGAEEGAAASIRTTVFKFRLTRRDADTCRQGKGDYTVEH
ncbi:MAG: hypothetical protein IJU46_06945 [Clostridia bacterium]|nr:hypothetical protein [Clostridia bacterium]